MLLKKKNRIYKQFSKYGMFWCGRCDANLVSDSKKCSSCGFKEFPYSRTKRAKTISLDEMSI